MTEDTEQVVRRLLESSSRSVDLTVPGPEAAVGRARQRQRRHRAALATLSAVAIAGAALGISSMMPVEEDSVVADWATTPASDQPAPSVPDQEATIVADEDPDIPEEEGLSLSWRVVDSTFRRPHDSVNAADGTTYAVNEAHGLLYGGPLAVYRTTDGETWEPTPITGDQAWLWDTLNEWTNSGRRELGERDGQLYTTGAVPGDGDDVVTAEILTSSDNGENWDPQTLPIEIHPPDGDLPMEFWEANSDLAVTEGVTAALVTAVFSPDVTSALAENGVDREQVTHTERTETGARYWDNTDCPDLEPGIVQDPELSLDRCTGPPSFVVEWSDYGIDPASLFPRHLLISTDGDRWEEVDLPPGTEAVYDDTYGGSIDLYGTSSGLLLSVFPTDPFEGETALFHSTDGFTWDEVARGGISLTSVSGDRVLASASEVTASGVLRESVLVSTNGGRTFVEQDLLALAPAGSEATLHHGMAAGPLGFAVVVSDPAPWQAPEPDYYLLTSVEGESWTVTDLDEIGMTEGPPPPDASGVGREVDYIIVGTDFVAVNVVAISDDAAGELQIDTKVLLGSPEP